MGCDVGVGFGVYFARRDIFGAKTACSFYRGICCEAIALSNFVPCPAGTKLDIFGIMHKGVLKTFAPLRFTPGIALRAQPHQCEVNSAPKSSFMSHLSTALPRSRSAGRLSSTLKSTSRSCCAYFGCYARLNALASFGAFFPALPAFVLEAKWYMAKVAFACLRTGSPFRPSLQSQLKRLNSMWQKIAATHRQKGRGPDARRPFRGKLDDQIAVNATPDADSGFTYPSAIRFPSSTDQVALVQEGENAIFSHSREKLHLIKTVSEIF